MNDLCPETSYEAGIAALNSKIRESHPFADATLKQDQPGSPRIHKQMQAVVPYSELDGDKHARVFKGQRNPARFNWPKNQALCEIVQTETGLPEHIQANYGSHRDTKVMLERSKVVDQNRE